MTITDPRFKNQVEINRKNQKAARLAAAKRAETLLYSDEETFGMVNFEDFYNGH